MSNAKRTGARTEVFVRLTYDTCNAWTQLRTFRVLVSADVSLGREINETVLLEESCPEQKGNHSSV
eukprot:scaffold3437_cov113-Cylindrotheca_fusiformis.AAC.40